ncbi:MAG: BMC domain-containing protein [Elusimicrobia bacterium]|nr:BMC domain-containing protein [Elusimicrobiota bacterium]MDE2236332.1 BMC domain-containing protein [Elusimicrobiota bacterium]MDE2426487.1 BMC domain-containing protein [Elusimicrobiota bacterium]
MQANLAVGFLELSSIAKGIEACDAMVKMASVTLARATVIARGKYVILVTGPVGEVESAMRAGRELSGKALLDEVLIRNIHAHVLAALDKRRPVERLEAVGAIETKDAIAAVLAADAAAKAAFVHVLEVKTVVPGGKGYVTLTGEVGAVRSAVAAGISAVDAGRLVSHVVIPQADGQLLATVGKSAEK